MSEKNLLQRIETLEAAVHDAEFRAKRAKEEWSSQYDAAKRLRQEIHQLESDYEHLRLQKGGFGFKSLLFVGLLSAVTTVFAVWIYLKVRPQPQHAEAFYKFRHETMINYELQLSRGEAEHVLRSLHEHEARPEFKVIQPEIEFVEKMIRAMQHTKQ